MLNLMSELEADQVLPLNDNEWAIIKEGQIKIGNGNTIKISQKGAVIRIIGSVNIQVDAPPIVEIAQENNIEIESVAGEEEGEDSSRVEITGDIHIVAVAKVTRL